MNLIGVLRFDNRIFGTNLHKLYTFRSEDLFLFENLRLKGGFGMLSINKKIVLDEEMKPFAVQIPIYEFNKIEEIFENFGLAKMMDEADNDEILSGKETKDFYEALKADVED
jgi:hypothetical protein